MKNKKTRIDILNEVCEKLKKYAFTVEYDGKEDKSIIINGKWFELYVSVNREIYVYDESNNLLFYTEDINKVIDFINRKVGR